MRPTNLFLLLSLSIACTPEITGGTPADAAGSPQIDGSTGGPDAMAIAPRYTVYLSVGGEALNPGTDDATTNVSSVIQSQEDIPALDPTDFRDSHSRAEITAALASQVTSLVSEFAIEVVTTRPSSGRYNMIVIGGTSAGFGFPSGSISVSPADCNNATIESPIGLVMSADPIFFPAAIDSYDAELEYTAIVIAQTMGFGLGLEQVTNCSDIMGWTAGTCSGPPRFLDEDTTCRSQPCFCNGGETANSAERLRDALDL